MTEHIISHLRSRLSDCVRLKSEAQNIIKEWKQFAKNDDRAYALCVTAKRKIKYQDLKIKILTEELDYLHKIT